jgi:hypothetical protein
LCDAGGVFSCHAGGGRSWHDVRMHDLRQFFRENPQVLLLLLICLILGLGTFLAVLFGLASSGPGHASGEPSGALMFPRALLAVALGGG